LAFPHIVFLTISALTFTIILLTRNGFKNIAPLEGAALVLLIACYTISISLSENPFNTLTGDTQRFTGAVSLFCFLVILIYHSNITIERSKALIISLTSIITIVTIVGSLQQWNLITLPGAGGTGSTLGNIDFLSAWIGTTIPLFLFLFTKSNFKKSALVIAELALSIYLLIALNVKQGWVDLILSIFFGAIYLLRHRLRSLGLSKKTIYWAFGLAGFLWIELVLLVPFQKTKVPLIGTDPNVQIRTQYWLAGLKTFFHSIFFGVGPDNYGNYYQQYRTLTSVLREETIASNDAHSAFFQTLSTLGIFGSLAFLAIFTLLVRAIIVNYHRYPSHRKLLYFITAFFVIYSTNAMISPITLPHKFIFWALVGLMFGLAYKPATVKQIAEIETPESEQTEELSFRSPIEFLQTLNTQKVLRPLIAITSTVSIFVILFTSVAQFKLVLAINDLQHNSKSSRIMNYQHSSLFPCAYYYLTEQTIANQSSIDKVIKFAEAEVQTNPRCVDARLTLAKYYFAKNDAAHLGWQIKALMEMAPANRDVLGLVGQVATKLGDRNLLGALHNQEVKLGYLK
jgi:O-antigen ligase